MEINQELLYIIIGVIYFLYGVWKNFKKKPVTREDQDSAEEGAGPGPHKQGRETVSDPFDERVGQPVPRKPSSFEELLQEFESVEGSAGRKAEEKVKKIQEVDDEYEPVYDDPDIRFNEQEAERQMRETEARKALQERASAEQRAVAVEKEVNRKMEQTIREDYSPSEPGQKKRYNQPKNYRRQQILEMLKNPDNVTNTILASEILRRKHF